MSIIGRMSHAPLEKEFKFRLTPASLLALKRAGCLIKTEAQTNHYFDVLPALPFAKSGVGIRLRNQDGTFFFTVKMPSLGGRKIRGLQIKREWEAKLTAAQASAVLKRERALTTFSNPPAVALLKHAKRLPLQQLQRIGQMKNIRLTVQFPNGLSLELDKFTIKNKVFYEAECETADPLNDRKKIKALWRSLKIPLQPETQSKLGRFLKAL